MEKDLLTPSKTLRPVEVGQNYRDYYLSEVLESNGCYFGCLHLELCIIKPRLLRLQLGFYAFSNNDLGNNRLIAICPVRNIDYFEGTSKISDARIRYYDGNSGQSSLVWVSVFSGEREIRLV